MSPAIARVALSMLVACLLAGCAGLVSKATHGLSTGLTQGILDQDDPETVAAGLPAYLLLLDGLIAGDPNNADLLIAASKLYSSYAGSFVGDGERRPRLAARAESYARRGVCVRDARLCAVLDAP